MNVYRSHGTEFGPGRRIAFVVTPDDAIALILPDDHIAFNHMGLARLVDRLNELTAKVDGLKETAATAIFDVPAHIEAATKPEPPPAPPVVGIPREAVEHAFRRISDHEFQQKIDDYGRYDGTATESRKFAVNQFLSRRLAELLASCDAGTELEIKPPPKPTIDPAAATKVTNEDMATALEAAATLFEARNNYRPAMDRSTDYYRAALESFAATVRGRLDAILSAELEGWKKEVAGKKAMRKLDDAESCRVAANAIVGLRRKIAGNDEWGFIS